MRPFARRITRRDILRGGIAGLGVSLLAPLSPARADDPAPKRLVMVEMQGGWDMLLSTDPRDPHGTYTGIDLGTDALDPIYRTPRSTRIGTGAFARDALLGSTTAALAPHDALLTLVRGLNMNTVSHPTGRAYMATGIAPAGTSPRGSSIGCGVADAWNRSAAPPLLPHVSLGGVAYNRDYDESASALMLAQANEVPDLLRPRRARRTRDETVAADLEALLTAARSPSYLGDDGMDPDARGGIERAMDDARSRLRSVDAEGLAARFDFSSRTDLQTLYGPDVSRTQPSPALAAATAAQLVKDASATDHALTAAVEVLLGTQLDTHRDWATDHPAALQPAFDALGAMLTDLRSSDPMLENTIVVVHSEFGRSALMNGSGGRDHHFASSMMIYGSSLATGVFGATGEQDLGLVAIDRGTGLPSASGAVLQPEDVFATLAAALSLDPSPYRTTPLPLVRA